MHTIGTTSTSATVRRVRETRGKSHISLLVTASVLVILASTLIAIVSGRTESVAATAPPLATPSGVTVAFTKSLAEIKWGAAPGATSYRVSIALVGATLTAGAAALAIAADGVGTYLGCGIS